MQQATIIHYMYRDGANYKSHGEVSFINPKGLTAEEIELRLNEAGIHLHDDELHFNDYQLRDYGFDSLSPIENEYLPFTSDVDHPYHEITDIENREVSDQFLFDNAISIKAFLGDLKAIQGSIQSRKVKRMKQALEEIEIAKQQILSELKQIN